MNSSAPRPALPHAAGSGNGRAPFSAIPTTHRPSPNATAAPAHSPDGSTNVPAASPPTSCAAAAAPAASPADARIRLPSEIATATVFGARSAASAASSTRRPSTIVKSSPDFRSR